MILYLFIFILISIVCFNNSKMVNQVKNEDLKALCAIHGLDVTQVTKKDELINIILVNYDNLDFQKRVNLPSGIHLYGNESYDKYIDEIVYCADRRLKEHVLKMAKDMYEEYNNFNLMKTYINKLILTHTVWNNSLTFESEFNFYTKLVCVLVLSANQMEYYGMGYYKYILDGHVKRIEELRTKLKEFLDDTEVSYYTMLEGESDCNICLMESLNNIVYLNVCKHEFCLECIKKWKQQKNTCPLCRAQML
ncbi:RING-finger-containing E3 ubiquitin ligase [Dasineura jujubifolia toursvirus 2a]|nr:RING-finger-containing E3 ubiquitin ligase [Dasineura jujubifolia toursvirus 2a]